MVSNRLSEPKWFLLDDLKLWDENYNEGDVGAIITSIKTFGFIRAVAVWKENVIRAGNHAVIALRQLLAGGWEIQGVGIRLNDKGQVELLCLDISFMETDEADAFSIADNHLGQMAVSNEIILSELLQQLINADNPQLMVATGYTPDDLDDMLNAINPAPPTISQSLTMILIRTIAVLNAVMSGQENQNE